MIVLSKIDLWLIGQIISILLCLVYGGLVCVVFGIFSEIKRYICRGVKKWNSKG